MLLQQKQIAGLLIALQALQTNIDGKTTDAAVNSAIQAAIADVVDNAPTALNTLKELAEALQNDEVTSTAALNALLVQIQATQATATQAATDAQTAIANAAQAEADAQTALTGVQTILNNEQMELPTPAKPNTILDSVFNHFNGIATAAKEMFASVGFVKNVYDALVIRTDAALKAKVSKIKNRDISFDDATIFAAYQANNGCEFTLPSEYTQALEVNINGQTFPVGTGEAFSIDGLVSDDGSYNDGDLLVFDGSKVAFELSMTDKIYVTLVSKH